mmetsp:Transcript_8515/g.9613  ORF Transcript_8515/g.9613 Transcript_8515/m.9613 type:complete len:87 (+) Transcript_8515:3-263(+)
MRMVIPSALKVLRLKPERRFCKLGDLSKEFGWKHQDLIGRLEDQRKVKALAYHKKRMENVKAGQKAKKEVTVSDENRKVLEAAGYM